MNREEFNDFIVTGEARGPDNFSVREMNDMRNLSNPQIGHRCHVQEEGTTYIHDGEDWIAQVNQGLLAQIENSDPNTYSTLTEERLREFIAELSESNPLPQVPHGLEGDFQRAMEEAGNYYQHVETTPESETLSSFSYRGELDPLRVSQMEEGEICYSLDNYQAHIMRANGVLEPYTLEGETGTTPHVTIDVNNLPDGWDVEEALRYYNDTGMIITEGRVSPVSDQAELMKKLQYENDKAHMKLQDIIAKTEPLKKKEGVFLGNIER